MSTFTNEIIMLFLKDLVQFFFSKTVLHYDFKQSFLHASSSQNTSTLVYKVNAHKQTLRLGLT